MKPFQSVKVLLLLFAAAGAGWSAGEISLWPKGAPGSEGKSGPERPISNADGLKRVAGIHNPSITPFLPAQPSGAAVIILPGGGHQYLSIENEGYAVAEWLAKHSVTGFVLKYRLAREPGSTYEVEKHALQDVQRAIRLVRSRAREWNLDPQRVGVMGFSAGGELAALAGMRFDSGDPGASDPVERESSRPSFQAPIYPGGNDAKWVVPKDAPPAFLLVAFDDKSHALVATNLYTKLRDAGINVELHVYSKGGHGFGMKDRALGVTSWPSRFLDWMNDLNLIRATTASLK